MRWPVPAVRAIGIALMGVAVALAVAISDPWLRVVLVSLVIAAGWMTHSAAERPTTVEPAAGWVRPHQRVDAELRRLTNLLLLYVREIFAIRERMREGAQDLAQGEARLDEIQREMGELIQRIVQAGAGK
jgi:hypothetical protein